MCLKLPYNGGGGGGGGFARAAPVAATQPEMAFTDKEHQEFQVCPLSLCSL